MTEKEKDVISLITTSELADALLDRFDHAVFYGIKDRPTEGQPSTKITCYRRIGDIFICKGIVVRMLKILMDTYEEAEEEIGADDL